MRTLETPHIHNMKTKLTSTLEKAYYLEPLTPGETGFLLQLEDEPSIRSLFQTASSLREKFFGNKIFFYGFLYTGTYCRNNCNFCFYRRSNPTPHRYRKDLNEIVSASLELARSGIHLIDLTMGEDPLFYTEEEENEKPTFESITKLIAAVKEATQLPVMISPGVVSPRVLDSLINAGADWYACYQETHNPELFKRLRLNQDYSARLQTKINAQQKGLLIEEGILVGVGENTGDVLESIHVMKELKADQVRAMNFVPQEGTPMQHTTLPHPLEELKITAVMRLIFPDRLIPASLDVEGLKGLKLRLDAGANVVTSIVPPNQGLAGVAQWALDIDSSRRTIAGIIPVLRQCNLKAAELPGYVEWMTNRKKIIMNEIQHRETTIKPIKEVLQ